MPNVYAKSLKLAVKMRVCFGQKLVIFEAPKFTKTNVILPGLCPKPCWEVYSTAISRPLGGDGDRCPFPRNRPHCRPFEPRASTLWTLVETPPLLMHTTLATAWDTIVEVDCYFCLSAEEREVIVCRKRRFWVHELVI